MKRKKFFFQDQQELKQALQSLSERYPQLQTSTITDFIHETPNNTSAQNAGVDGTNAANDTFGVCSQVLFVEALNSTIFDIALTDFVKELGGVPA